MTKFRTQYSDPLKVGLSCSKEERLTKSSFKDETDINKIMERYLKTGQVPGHMLQDQKYVDVSTLPTNYLDAVRLVEEAEDAFYALPAKVREDCQNDPAVFLSRVQDPNWAIQQGLAVKTPTTPLATPGFATTGSGEAPNPPSAKKSEGSEPKA